MIFYDASAWNNVVSTCCSKPEVNVTGAIFLRQVWRACLEPSRSWRRIQIFTSRARLDRFWIWTEKSQSDVEKNVCFHPGPFLFSQWSRFLLYTDHLTMTYWCLVGNGWDWGNGMIITSDYGSFPHSLLSTSKILITWKWGRLAAYPIIQTRNRGDVERGLERPVLAGEKWVDQLMRFDPRTRTSWSICLLLIFGRYLHLFAVARQHWWLISYWKHDPE